ncbi:class I SAM-dependent methyltransferase [Gillisia hiemivivida]|uniref:Class I SAM-dependent methyltransferase n=1 Tax=Gillisia hiemivivida TaxID=291190 RepID=A0A5C6ZVG2_9FLAO|nr:class I SAM-dependent methyltransferase [Gillisia hiemivivida]TXD93900.1 class I SAM-dependent methyltransferase [Gillisia hiemivivida]
MSIKRTEDVNLKQKEFYETKKKNLATKIWSYFRNGILNQTRKSLGVERQILDLHTSWLGDLSDKKVLDLGCYAGNSLSFYLAKNSKEYIAIDLSEVGINRLSERLKDLRTAKAYTVDFLSSEFKENNFDIIYAYGVLHHFKNVNQLIERLQDKLNEDGKIISYDPLETSIPIKIIRSLYRPFQSDKEWEWPFTKKVYFKFENAFEILERRAILGKSKWFFLLNLLPYTADKKISISKEWHIEDWEKSQYSNSHMFSCMHLTILMKKK